MNCGDHGVILDRISEPGRIMLGYESSSDDSEWQLDSEGNHATPIVDNLLVPIEVSTSISQGGASFSANVGIQAGNDLTFFESLFILLFRTI